MFELIFASIRSTERDLKGKAISQIELSPQSYLNIGECTLEAPSLSFWIWKQQSLNEKVLQFVLTIAGKTCSFLLASLLQPYIKQFFLRE
jgi:hypothetical protein